MQKIITPKQKANAVPGFSGNGVLLYRFIFTVTA